MRKWWNEMSKHRKLINPIDLGVMILLLVAVWRLFAVYLPAMRPAQTAEVTVSLLIRNVPVYVCQSIAVGQDLFQDGTESYVGKISVKQVQPAQWAVSKNGRWALVQAPGRFDLSLKLQRSGRIIAGPRSGIFLGKLAVRIGERLRMHTLYTSITGEVVAIRLQNPLKGDERENGRNCGGMAKT